MNRIKAILAAGAITSTVVVALAAINFRGIVEMLMPAETAAAEAASMEAAPAQEDPVAAAMDARQADYAHRMSEANKSILTLERAIADLEAQQEADAAALVEKQAELDSANALVYQISGEAQGWQSKEAGYAAQIEAANQQIIALQAQIAQMTGQ